jgi:NADPH:quinone reductase-like Zn-dependent oxidoreductase
MKRIEYSSSGPASTFVLADTDEPAAAAGHLVVDIMAAGLNPLDFKVSSGLIPMMTGPDFPKAFATDLAGVVTGIGADVTGFNLGDRVFGSIPIGVSGAFAERASIPAVNTALLAETISFDQGAAL